MFKSRPDFRWAGYFLKPKFPAVVFTIGKSDMEKQMNTMPRSHEIIGLHRRKSSWLSVGSRNIHLMGIVAVAIWWWMRMSYPSALQRRIAYWKRKACLILIMWSPRKKELVLCSRFRLMMTGTLIFRISIAEEPFIICAVFWTASAGPLSIMSSRNRYRNDHTTGAREAPVSASKDDQW